MTPEQIWLATMGELRLVLAGTTYRTWLTAVDLRGYDFDTNAFTISVPDQQTCDWLQNRLLPAIQRTLTGISGRPAAVTFIVTEQQAESDISDEVASDKTPEPDWQEYGIPPLFIVETLETADWSRPALNKPELRSYAQHFIEYGYRGLGLTLIGPPGVGKTHVAVGLLKVAILAGWTARFTGVAPLLSQLRGTFATARLGIPTQSEHQILHQLTTVRLLVLDDLRIDTLTPWGRDRLYAVLNPRWEAALPTIVTSNYSPDELAAGLGRDRPGMDDGTLSRLVRSALTIQLQGDDHRVEIKCRKLNPAGKQHTGQPGRSS